MTRLHEMAGAHLQLADLRQHAAAIDPASASDAILSILCELTYASRGSVLLHSPRHDALYIAAAKRLPPDVLGSAIPRDRRSVANWVFRANQPLILNGAVSDSRFNALGNAAESTSSLCAPLIHGGTTIGVVNLGRDGSECFSSESVSTIQEQLDLAAEVLFAAIRAVEAERALQAIEAMGASTTPAVLETGVRIGPYELGLAFGSGLSVRDTCLATHRGQPDSLLFWVDRGTGPAALASTSCVRGAFHGCVAHTQSAAGLVARVQKAHSASSMSVPRGVLAACLRRNGIFESAVSGLPAPYWVPLEGRPRPIDAAEAAGHLTSVNVRLLRGEMIAMLVRQPGCAPCTPGIVNERMDARSHASVQAIAMRLLGDTGDDTGPVPDGMLALVLRYNFDD